jgi:hypothetical protein
MWTLKIVLLAAGVTVTAFASNSAADIAACAAPHESAAEQTPETAIADDRRADCLAGRWSPA